MDIGKTTMMTTGALPVSTAARAPEAAAFNTKEAVSITGAQGDTLTQKMDQLKQMSQTSKVSAAPALGSKEFWVNQATHMTDFFAKVSKDDVNGGFFTHIDAQGNVSNKDEKFLMPTSRQVWAYAATYEMTGDKTYLDLAKHGVDFELAHHMKTNASGETFWMQRVNGDGSLGEGETAKPIVINEQTYGLTGLIGYYKATKDPKILEVIKSGHQFLTNHMWDKKDGAFFDSVDPKTLEPSSTKSYNSVVYPATSALLEMADIADGPWKKEVCGQLKTMADIFVKNFPDPKTGFIKENFTTDWKEDWRNWQKQPEGSIGVSGHNTQGALFLLRTERLLSAEGMLKPEEAQAYRNTAQTIVDSMLEKTYDKENGGFFDVFVRETGQNMWHTNKAFWQQEEGYLATLAMSKLTGDSKYTEAANKTLQFWDKNFMDREIGGDRQTVAKDGAPLTDPKGGPGKSSYHSTEMAKLAMEINNW
ncbi:MAG: AGE family epimerase/isomerase [Firmicutes bacterium]|nr:AGE family epimerase/isomerase [Bacillota bacterium]